MGAKSSNIVNVSLHPSGDFTYHEATFQFSLNFLRSAYIAFTSRDSALAYCAYPVQSVSSTVSCHGALSWHCSRFLQSLGGTTAGGLGWRGAVTDWTSQRLPNNPQIKTRLWFNSIISASQSISASCSLQCLLPPTVLKD